MKETSITIMAALLVLLFLTIKPVSLKAQDFGSELIPAKLHLNIGSSGGLSTWNGTLSAEKYALIGFNITKHFGVSRFMIRPSFDSKLGIESDWRRSIIMMPNLCIGYQYGDTEYGMVGIGYRLQFLKGIVTTSEKKHIDSPELLLGLSNDFNIAKLTIFLGIGLRKSIDCIVDGDHYCQINTPIVDFSVMLEFNLVDFHL